MSKSKLNADIMPAFKLVLAGMKLVKLHTYEKRPIGVEWSTNSENFAKMETVDLTATGYGLPLAINGLVSIDPDRKELAAIGLKACGFDLEELMSAGVRTTSTRPESGGRSTFADPKGLKWLKFSSGESGTVLELRATSSNLQDVVAGAVYRSKDGEHYYRQDYANGKTHADAKDIALPDSFREWWHKCSSDINFYREQQQIFFNAIGDSPNLAVSSGSVDGKLELAFKSAYRGEYNRTHSVEEILERHNYSLSVDGRYAPPTATGAPAVRPIPSKDGLWQSDHASDPLHGTFDAWTAFVQLDHKGDLSAAEADAAMQRDLSALEGFEVLAPDAQVVLPAFERRDSGKIIVNRSNLLLALTRSELCGMGIALDAFTGGVVVDDHGVGAWRAFTDADYTKLSLRLERGSNGFTSIPSQLLREVVHYVASERSVDSAVIWLNGLKWDGVCRLEGVLPDYFGAENTPYTRAVGRYMFTALAGRVLEAGIQADMVVAVVGAQGLKKSSTVAAIAPLPEAFMELDLGESDADLSRKMRGKLVIELGELVGMRRKQKEELKAFITRKHERWIPKYMEHEKVFARRNIFIATTNSEQFLDDETGNRRWLPFTCGECHPDAMARDREQLWAEGAARFQRDGIAWQDAQRLAESEHEHYIDRDDLADDVLKYLHTSTMDLDGAPSLSPFELGRVTVAEVLRYCQRLLLPQRPPITGKRVQKILRQLGWSSSGNAVLVESEAGNKQRLKYWTPKPEKGA
jgi:hypothetical protein